MSDDIVIQLKDLASTMKRGEGRSTVYGAVSEIERLRAEVARLGSFIHPIGTIIHDNPRRVAETLGSGEHISAPFDGTVKDIHASCRNEVERWQDIARNLYLFIQDPCTHDHWCDVCSSVDTYEQAVCGD